MYSVKSIFKCAVVAAFSLFMLSGCIVVEPDHHYHGYYGHRYPYHDGRYVEPYHRGHYGDRDDDRD